MKTALSLATKLADDIKRFPLEKCAPDDPPDKEYAFVTEFRDITKRFVAALRRIGDPDLSSMVVDLNTSPGGIVEAHDLRAEIFTVIDTLEEATQDPNYGANAARNAAFLDNAVLADLKAVQSTRLDTSKLVKMCEELNDAYARGNYISSALLLRAIINHIPPVFGAKTFSQVVAHSGRSVKAILARLEDEARPIADLHTHILIRLKEHLPTKNQLEPYKAGFEVLIQEVIVKLSNDGA
ncbi:MAG: hypothetical protein KAR54_03780 [Candidatus Pacebacteria bacterium]|nr:hypothetical protein [Candidatus Paceibacterota bacterium]